MSFNNTYTDKLSRNATIFSSLFALPAVTQAIVINNTTSLTISINDARSSSTSITEPFNGGTKTTLLSSVDWDVDGNSITDFNLNAIAYSFRDLPSFSNPDRIGIFGQILLKSARSNQQSIIKPYTLSTNILVGPDLTPNLKWEKWKTPISVGTMYSDVSFLSPGFEDLYLKNPIIYYIGFNILGDNEQILYGWSKISVDTDALNLTIEQWAYEDNGGSIKVGQISSVPLPSSMLLTLSGLAMGAGGILRGRKARKNKK